MLQIRLRSASSSYLKVLCNQEEALSINRQLGVKSRLEYPRNQSSGDYFFLFYMNDKSLYTQNLKVTTCSTSTMGEKKLTVITTQDF